MTSLYRLFLVVFLGFLVFGCSKKSGIEGRVVDGKGKPLPDVKIIAKQVQPIKGYEQFETTTGSDGKFCLRRLYPASEYILLPQSENWATDYIRAVLKSGPEGETSILTSDIVLRFTSPKDGIITDCVTGLQWAQDTGADNRMTNEGEGVRS